MSLAAEEFAKNSFGWQLQKLGQWAQEGLERLFARGGSSAPEPSPQLPIWLLEAIFWLLTLSLAGWLIWQLYQILRPFWESLRSPRLSRPEPSRSATNWLRQAQLAQAQGDYAAACRALYLAALQKLSEQDLIAPQSSRTDGEYLALLRQLSLPQPYQMLIQTHERLYFDRFAASAELYAECWQAYQTLEPQAKPQAELQAPGTSA
jgi:hypothetical protein